MKPEGAVMTHPRMDKFKIAVDKRVLLLLAGLMWIAVGAMLMKMAYTWLSAANERHAFAFGAAGVALALMVHHFGFLKVVDKNLGRIMPMEGKRCIFAFISWKSYLLIAVMVMLGITLRHSPLPRQHLAVIYIGIGLALVLSSVRYLRMLLRNIRNCG